MGNSSALPVCDKDFSISVEFCGPSGYTKNFSILSRAFLKTFPKATISGGPARSTNGCFEVVVFPNPSERHKYKLVHSKLKGDPLVDKDNVQDVIAKIHKIVTNPSS